MKKYGILGGSFNPPHIAHSIVAESVREQLELDKIIFIPSGNHPLKKSLPAKQRFEMSKIAFGDNKNFEVSDIEIQNPDEKSYTVNTLEKLNKNYENENMRLSLIIGMDNLIEFPKWKEPERLFLLSEVIVINRPDYSVIDSKTEFLSKVKLVTVPFLEISSSMIRELVSLKRSVRYLVSPGVEDYILKNELYVSA
ncbi:MAG: nicotinate-nucleotide adenylyltransferase [Ignavibacteria bacterium]